MSRKILEDLTTKERAGGNRGFSMLELIIVVTVVGVVTGFALLQVQSTSANMRVQNSVRQLSSYMEKARVDAVRRHGNSAVTFTNPTTYTVNMDFNNNGTPITRTFSFQDGVRLASSDLPNVTFNWRGRTLTSGASCATTFSVSDSYGNGLSVDVSGSGDVTVENQQPTLPNVAFNNTVTSSDGINGRAVVSGVTAADNTPCMDLSGGGVGGASGPPDCTIGTNSTSITVRKNGASTGSVIISMSSTKLVVASYPSNLTVSPASQTLNTGSNFAITSKNTLRGPFNVTFTSQCGSSITVTVNVTN